MTPYPLSNSEIQDYYQNEPEFSVNYSRIFIKTQSNNDKSGLQNKIDEASKKIPNTIGLIKKVVYNAKITEIGGKISCIADLTTTESKHQSLNILPHLIKIKLPVKKLIRR